MCSQNAAQEAEESNTPHASPGPSSHSETPFGPSLPSPSSIATATAELSRPFRQFVEDLRAERDPRGRKRIRDYEEASRVNWANPFLFAQMDAVAHELGPEWCLAEIVRTLQFRNPRNFSTLTPQVLGRYVERPPNETPRWKTAYLIRVLQGNKPIANITRSGILVSYISSFIADTRTEY